MSIPPADAATKAKLSSLADRAAKLAVAGDTPGVTKVEREIDAIVYRLFDLTPAEIALIETALVPVRNRADTLEEVECGAPSTR